MRDNPMKPVFSQAAVFLSFSPSGFMIQLPGLTELGSGDGLHWHGRFQVFILRLVQLVLIPMQRGDRSILVPII